MATEEIDVLLKQAIAAARNGNKAEARRLLEQILAQDDANEQAWLLMAGVVDTPRERRICLETVLEINPENEKAKQALAMLKPSPPSTGTVPTPKPAPSTLPSQQPRSGTSRTPQPPVQAPTKRAGVTTPGTTDAWRSQRSRGRLRPAFVFAAVLALALVGLGLFLIAGTEQPATPTPAVVVQQPTALPRLSTPTPPGTVVEYNPNAQTIPPTWTPTPTPTERPTEPPAPTLVPVSAFTLAFVGEGRGRGEPTLYTIRGDGTGEQRLGSAEGRMSDVAWSPDGRRIAYTTVVESREQIAVADADGGNEQVITSLAGDRARGADWSPDGRRIAFFANDAGNNDIYVINADGSNQRRITSGETAEIDPAWSPDGKQLVYAADPTGRGGLQIFVIEMESQAANPVTQLTSSQNQNYSPAWSPDGRSIVFVSTRNRFPRIFIMRADGSDERVLTFDDGNAENRDPAWSPDGSYIVFGSTRNGGVMNLFVMTADGRNVQQVTNASGASYGGKFKPGF